MQPDIGEADTLQCCSSFLHMQTTKSTNAAENSFEKKKRD